MPSHHGNEGTVKIGANAVAEIQEWSFTETLATESKSSMGDAYDTMHAGMKSVSGSMRCWWDETDTTGQGALTVGAQVTLDLYPEGVDTGDTYYSGDVLITEVGVSTSKDGNVERSFSFVGDDSAAGLAETTA